MHLESHSRCFYSISSGEVIHVCTWMCVCVSDAFCPVLQYVCVGVCLYVGLHFCVYAFVSLLCCQVERENTLIPWNTYSIRDSRAETIMAALQPAVQQA